MRKIYFLSLTLLCLTLGKLSAQNVAVNENGNAANASAILDVQSTTKGVLVPRMTEVQRAAITLPAKGLMVYQTDNTEGYYYNAGTEAAPSWVKIGLEKTAVAFAATTTVIQNYTAPAFAKVQFNTEEYDEANSFIPVPTSEFTVPSAGIYHFDAAVVVNGANGSRWDVAIFVNNIQKKTMLGIMPGFGLLTLQVSADLKMNTGDKIDVRVAGQSSGSVVGGSAPWIWFNGRKVN